LIAPISLLIGIGYIFSAIPVLDWDKRLFLLAGGLWPLVQAIEKLWGNHYECWPIIKPSFRWLINVKSLVWTTFLGLAFSLALCLLFLGIDVFKVIKHNFEVITIPNIFIAIRHVLHYRINKLLILIYLGPIIVLGAGFFRVSTVVLRYWTFRLFLFAIGKM